MLLGGGGGGGGGGQNSTSYQGLLSIIGNKTYKPLFY